MTSQASKGQGSNAPRFSILIINPNTSPHMTEALRPSVEKLDYADVQIEYFTAPSTPTVTPDGTEIQGIPSINSGADSSLSAHHCFPHLKKLLDKYDAFLVACFSAHPLVGMLKREIRLRQRHSLKKERKYVTGIFEASISTCLTLTRDFSLSADTDSKRVVSASSFGIVTTATAWKDELTTAVQQLLLGDQTEKQRDDASRLDVFAGVGTTGLTAAELHDTPAEEVRARIADVTEQLIKDSRRPVAAICLGCAAMAGMDAAVREGCVRALGRFEGENVFIVDGVLSGLGALVNACKAEF
ncbi:hypothetical protein VTO42DRAFT_7353 [Malbranchea cinnamomea]